jgi:uncharacterized integral membrane protein
MARWLWLLFLLIVVMLFTLSNQGVVTVSFWQWPIYSGPLALVVVGAGIVGALVTYLSSLPHHVRQGRRIRGLEDRLRSHEDQRTAPSSGPTATVAPSPETRRIP